MQSRHLVTSSRALPGRASEARTAVLLLDECECAQRPDGVLRDASFVRSASELGGGADTCYAAAKRKRLVGPLRAVARAGKAVRGDRARRCMPSIAPGMRRECESSAVFRARAPTVRA